MQKFVHSPCTYIISLIKNEHSFNVRQYWKKLEITRNIVPRSVFSALCIFSIHKCQSTHFSCVTHALRRSCQPAGRTTCASDPHSRNWPTCWRNCPSSTADSRTLDTSGNPQSMYCNGRTETQGHIKMSGNIYSTQLALLTEMQECLSRLCDSSQSQSGNKRKCKVLFSLLTFG